MSKLLAVFCLLLAGCAKRNPPAVALPDWHFPLFLAHGVTGVRNVAVRCVVAGEQCVTPDRSQSNA